MKHVLSTFQGTPRSLTIITPAEAPSAAASTRWFARLVQNTSMAPKHVHMPAATTSPKARATFP
jgi:hypothetical protein